MTSGERAEVALHLPKVDWNQLLALARCNHLVPLLRFHLQQHATQVPSHVAAQMEQAARPALQHNLLLTRELIRILVDCERNGIAVYPYKGPALAYPAYRGVSLREFEDIDLLLETRDFPAIKTLLSSSLGYSPATNLDAIQERMYLRSASDATFVNAGLRVQVDVHWRILPDYFSGKSQLAVLLRQTSQVDIAGQKFAAMSPEATLVALSAHGFKHAWNRLSWVCDISQWLAAFPDLQWPEASKMAEELGWRRMLLLGVGLAQTLLGAELPPEASEAVAQDSSLPHLEARAARHMFEPFDQETKTVSRYALFWGGRERWADRLRYLFSARPGIGEWQAKPIPGRLSFLYPAARLARMSRRLAVSLRHMVAPSHNRKEPS